MALAGHFGALEHSFCANSVASPPPQMSSRGGFTLIEIAIVLTVIGILLSGGLFAVTPIVQQAAVTETKAKMDVVRTALLTYVIARGCLPCPAAGNLASGAANAGEALNDAGFPYTGCSATGCDLISGAVPWRNMGLAEAEVTDAYGNRFTYAVDSDLTRLSTSMTRVAGSYPDGDLVVTDLGPARSDFAYVLVSHGRDGSLANAAETGVARADKHGSANQLENADGDVDFVSVPVNSIDGPNYFDDIVRYETPPILIQACGAGSCGNPS